jgi:hypothetical protein
MNIMAFKSQILGLVDEQALLNFFQKNFFHGTPHVFNIEGKTEEMYFEFRKLISDNYNIHYNELIGKNKRMNCHF